MVGFERDGNMSITVSCDDAGLSALIQAVGNARNSTAGTLEVMFDQSVMTLKQTSPTELTTMAVVAGESTGMHSSDHRPVLTLEAEDADCLLALLSSAQEKGAFEPPELVRVQVPKNHRLDCLYGVMVGVQ